MPGVNDKGETVEAGSPEDNRPRSQIDLELRLAAGHDPKEFAKQAAEREGTGTPVNYAVEGNDTSGYIGVSQEYATYANETEAPLQGTEGVEAEAGAALTRPLRHAVVDPELVSKQIDGIGSADPVLYPEVSGDIYKTEQVKVGESAVPTTVEEAEALSTEDAPNEGSVVTPASKPPAAQVGNPAPQGAESGDKVTENVGASAPAAVSPPAPVKPPKTS